MAVFDLTADSKIIHDTNRIKQQLNKHIFYSTLLITFILTLSGTAVGFQNLTFKTSGGYSGNLYADSSAIGDSYVGGAISISSTNFNSTRLRIYYDLSYSRYAARANINNFIHIGGIALYDRKRGQRLKWGMDIAGTVRDYVDDNSDFDNYKLYFTANGSYYLKKTLQTKLLYRAAVSSYSGFENLDYTEHWIRGEVAQTFRTKTTARGRLNYSIRRFDEDKSVVDWLDLEIRLSQSIDIRTGLSWSGLVRWAGGGTRPLSSYFIISGITPYWDPWDGFQLMGSLKRIHPFGIISILGFEYWDREFNYSEQMKYELPWIAGEDGRNEQGWSLNLDIKRQFNLYGDWGRTVVVNTNAGYISNGSDDPFYEYDYFYIRSDVAVAIF